jgi:hypothetical protein
VGVPPLVLVPGVALPFIGDADTAREPGFLVHDHDLAVRPMVDLRRLQPVQWSIPVDAHASVLHLGDQARLDGRRAPCVQQHPNPNTRARLVRKRIGEPRADLAAPVDEGQQIDRAMRLADRVEHRGEDLVAVDEHVDEVPLRGGDPDDSLERAADLVGPVLGRSRGRFVSMVVTRPRRPKPFGPAWPISPIPA